MNHQDTDTAFDDLRLVHRGLNGSKEELFRLFERPTPDILRAALRNPALDEAHLLALLRHTGLHPDLFTLLHQQHEPPAGNYQVLFALAQHPEAPPHIVSTLLPRLHLCDLLKLSCLPSIPQDQKVAAERAIIQRIPTQPLGNKLTLAHRGTATIVEALLKEGQPQLVAACLDNPHLKEGAIHQFLASAAATAETISRIARHTRWQHRPELQQAILKNPRTPTIWFTLFLPRLPRSVVQNLAISPRLTPPQKQLVTEALGGKKL
ncbi:MAG: hypothetical protein OEL57_06420 [Trichlorobacter sp.]|uniref:hypothetical protein n=1 Tax=Trichlorobacter sp. TaxID=2911007 RepID=UPI00256C7992|nr:hypothetical protein [Trichlorobacter sp.]MDK9717531.1 hypothetical protein [Trichlorobacter sp.]